MPLKVGSIVEGVVTGITNFGAFVQLPSGETGLVHISEVADSYVKDINEYLKKSEAVKVKILSVDGDGKIGLSIRKAISNPSPKQKSRREDRISFEDKLARYLKESDERLQDLRRNTEAKRGGRGTYREAY
ncbi:MAG TPA: S1 RNA-binding domain-containing protein [Bacillota bacterium]|nr:S1 RNA-binding domain-containing protein [Bacillota bacterium]